METSGVLPLSGQERPDGAPWSRDDSRLVRRTLATGPLGGPGNVPVVEGRVGFEPTTGGLKVPCSTAELTAHGQRNATLPPRSRGPLLSHGVGVSAGKRRSSAQVAWNHVRSSHRQGGSRGTGRPAHRSLPIAPRGGTDGAVRALDHLTIGA